VVVVVVMKEVQDKMVVLVVGVGLDHLTTLVLVKDHQEVRGHLDKVMVAALVVLHRQGVLMNLNVAEAVVVVVVLLVVVNKVEIHKQIPHQQEHFLGVGMVVLVHHQP
jgi:hypothetical protein